MFNILKNGGEQDLYCGTAQTEQLNSLVSGLNARLTSIFYLATAWTSLSMWVCSSTFTFWIFIYSNVCVLRGIFCNCQK